MSPVAVGAVTVIVPVATEQLGCTIALAGAAGVGLKATTTFLMVLQDGPVVASLM